LNFFEIILTDEINFYIFYRSEDMRKDRMRHGIR